MIYKVIPLYILYWILLSESYDVQTVIIGIILCTGITLLDTKLSIINNNKQKLITKRSKYLYEYALLLLKEMVLANIQVARKVLSPKMDISPSMVTITTRLKTDFYRTILANSITLTPGTITVAIEDDTLTIHCLEKDYVEGLINSKFEEILLKVEACR